MGCEAGCEVVVVAKDGKDLCRCESDDENGDAALETRNMGSSGILRTSTMEGGLYTLPRGTTILGTLLSYVKFTGILFSTAFAGLDTLPRKYVLNTLSVRSRCVGLRRTATEKDEGGGEDGWEELKTEEGKDDDVEEEEDDGEEENEKEEDEGDDIVENTEGMVMCDE